MSGCPFASKGMTGSGCPFASKRKAIKEPFSHAPEPVALDPILNTIDPDYCMPYISPYFESFNKFSLKKPSPLAGIPFYLQNSIFHQQFIIKYRKSDFMTKALVANDLRESGNRKYQRGMYEKAAVCYEHGLCLFKYGEVIENDAIKIFTTEIDATDTSAYNGMILQLCMNYAITLIKMKHFYEAQLILSEAFSLSNSRELKVLEALCKLNNIESGLEEISELKDIIIASGSIKPEYSALESQFSRLILELTQKSSNFFQDFFKEFSIGVMHTPKSKFQLEVNVIEKLNDKYTNMIEYYRGSEILSRVLAERKDVLKVFYEMKKIKSIKSNDCNILMRAHAKQTGIDLSSPKFLNRLESAKISMITKCFNKGSYNKRLLYACIQESINEFENKSVVQDKLEIEYQFWKRNLIFVLFLAVVVYLCTRSTVITNF
jgi:tetratricopeptide (TPR) repeat protein